MTQVEQIQAEIEALPQEDFIRLREWFAEKDWWLWDKQLETDIADGKTTLLTLTIKLNSLLKPYLHLKLPAVPRL